MPFNGTGTFTLNQDFPADSAAGSPNNKISSSKVDNEFQNIKSGLELCVTRDGQNTASADLPMGTNKHTNVGNAALRNQYASAEQVQDSTLTYIADTGAADAYVLTLVPAIAAYAAGQKFTFKATNTNTGASTLNVNGLGVKSIKKSVSTDLAAGDITAGEIITATYDGTNFQIAVAPTSTFTASSTDTLTNKTFDSNGTGNTLSNVSWTGDGAAGTDGEVPTFDASGNPSFVAAGTSGHVLTSNGAGAAPTFQEAAGGGKLVGFATSTTSTSGSTTTSIPADTSIPQNTEGAEILTVSYTPTNASNTLIIRYNGFWGENSAAVAIHALFQDSTANALTAIPSNGVGGAGSVGNVSLVHTMTAGTTSSTTFKIRGGAASGTFYWLRSESVVYFGAAGIATLTVEEWEV